MRVFFPLILVLPLLSSCAVFKSAESRKALKIKREVEHSPVFAKSFTGFTLMDPATGKMLVDVNGEHYFTPASNVKILTLATCLEVLGDSVPGLLYQVNEQGLNFRGTGDPTFLHPKFQVWQQIAARLRDTAYHVISWISDPYLEPLGPGWAWDDAGYSYSTERSTMPVFGNVSRIYAATSDSLAIDDYNWHRLQKFDTDYDDPIGNDHIAYTHGSMLIRYSPKDTFSKDFEVFVPIKNVSNIEIGFHITGSLLELGLQRRVLEGASGMPWQSYKLWYSTPIDTVLRRMMHQSDNFIAEQMLLVCARVKYDFFDQYPVISWMLDTLLTTLPQRPKWVDGSGLSRYNLMTPQSISQVLLRLWKTQPKERLFSLFPAGGMNGTIENWYCGQDGNPYVFAKSGSMGGVYCLSGYVVCRSGKVLIFSFMHNNFVGSNTPWKTEMQRILEVIQAY